MRKTIALLALVAVVFVGAPLAGATGNKDKPKDKVTICHYKEHSDSYMVKTVDKNGAASGHADHKHGMDIIPPFDYKKGRKWRDFPGQNWDDKGKETYNNGCVPVPEESEESETPEESEEPEVPETPETPENPPTTEVPPVDNPKVPTPTPSAATPAVPVPAEATYTG